jgi:hypothetical protein
MSVLVARTHHRVVAIAGPWSTRSLAVLPVTEERTVVPEIPPSASITRSERVGDARLVVDRGDAGDAAPVLHIRHVRSAVTPTSDKSWNPRVRGRSDAKGNE